MLKSLLKHLVFKKSKKHHGVHIDLDDLFEEDDCDCDDGSDD